MSPVSRGKKIYKSFPQDSESEREDSPTNDGQDSGIMTDVELSRLRPLTRSSLKPKLLFPNTKQKAEPSASALTDEEALTEVEDSTKLKSKDVVTPVKQSFGPATPPTTGHATRSSTQKSRATPQSDEDVRGFTPGKPLGRKRVSPFDSWQRTKPAGNVSRGKKRDASELDSDVFDNGKRLRSSDT